MMAIAVSFGFLIIRKSSIDNKYPGGITQFRQDWLPRRRNRPLTGEDEDLFGFYSMGGGMRPLIDSLEEAGFSTIETQPSPDLAFGTITDSFLASCDWLQIAGLEEQNGIGQIF